jgi:hypothetical protein
MSAVNREHIERACERLVVRFAHYIDRGRYEEFAQLFTQDGEFTRRGMSSRGQDEILASVKQRPANTVTRHVCGAPCFEKVMDDEATAVTYLVMYQADRNESGPTKFSGPAVIAEYYDVFRNTSEGWRLAQRIAQPVMIREN